MKIVIEASGEDAETLTALKNEYPDVMKSAQAHNIDGTEWLAFVVDITKTLAPHFFALLTIIVTSRRNVVVIHNGERKELTKSELETLKKEAEKDLD